MINYLMAAGFGFLLGVFALMILLDSTGLLAASAGRSYYNCTGDGGSTDHCRDKYLLWMIKPGQ